MIKKIMPLILALLLLPPFAFAATATNYLVIKDVDFEEPIVPGSILPITVELENIHQTYNINDLEIKIWLENVFGEKLTKAAVSGLIIQEADDREITLKLNIPSDLEPGTYILKISASGRLERSTEKVLAEYSKTVEVEPEDDSLYISKIEFSKQNYKPGEDVDVAITIINTGLEDQENVNVLLLIPELNIQKTITLYDAFFSRSTRIIYFTFKLPSTLDKNIYTVTAIAKNDFARTTSNANLIISLPEKINTDKLSSTIIKKELKRGQSFDLEIKVTNRNSEEKDYKIQTKGSLAIELSEIEFTLLPGQSKTILAKITAKQSGPQNANITVFEQNNPISEVNIQADVIESKTTLSTILFLALIFIIVILALILQNKKERSHKTTAYY